MSDRPGVEAIKAWREDPVLFVRDNFHVEPDHWQVELLRAFGDQNVARMRIALKACAGPGKTAGEAWCGWNFLSCYADRGEHPKGAAVSITADNLKDNLWAEMAKWQNVSPFLLSTFQWTAKKIFNKNATETWFISARSFPQTADANALGSTLSGLHSKFVLYLIDESGEIPPAVGKAAEQGLSNCEFGRIVQAGNPTSTSGMLHQACTILAGLWRIVNITGDPDDPKRSQRIDIDWAKEQIKLYGRQDPWVMAYILSQFPATAFNALLGPDQVMEAMSRHLRKDQYDYAQKRIGIDVARFGDDSTILFPRQGLRSHRYAEMRGARTNEIAARVMAAKAKWQSEMELVDDTGGYGAGVIDSLILGGHAPTPISFSGKAIDSRYFNKRSEIWFLMAEWVKRGGALPQCPTLQKELTAPRYTFHEGKLRLEEKDQIKKRLGFSPDRADALALTFGVPEMPAQRSINGLIIPHQPQETRLQTEWDPFAN